MTAIEAGRKVVIHTDGACSPNPGPGGWGAILRYGDAVKEIRGGEEATTNNRMELMAAIQALEALTRPTAVVLHTDSAYVKNGIQSWIVKWKRNGWITGDRQPVKNADLWQRLEAAIADHDVQWLWVKGHSGDPGNERADELAAQGMRETLGEDLLPPAPVPRPGSKQCAATTKERTPCLIDPRPSGLCHIHDPAVQCGVINKKGRPCATATGGGPCNLHRTSASAAATQLF